MRVSRTCIQSPQPVLLDPNINVEGVGRTREPQIRGHATFVASTLALVIGAAPAQRKTHRIHGERVLAFMTSRSGAVLKRRDLKECRHQQFSRPAREQARLWTTCCTTKGVHGSRAMSRTRPDLEPRRARCKLCTIGFVVPALLSRSRCIHLESSPNAMPWVAIFTTRRFCFSNLPIPNIEAK